MEWKFSVQKLELKRAFTISRQSSRYRETVRLALSSQGLTGWGEAAPNPRHGETIEMATSAFRRLQHHAFNAKPSDREEFLGEASPVIGPVFSARAAVDMAVHDWYGKSLGKPLHEIWKIPAKGPLRVSMTISIDTPEMSAERALEASEFKVLKVKLGSPMDRENILAIREVTDTPLWVDANEGWRDPDQALEMIKWLSGQGVELVEQPLPAGRSDDLRRLKDKSPLPLIADESFAGLSDLEGIEGSFHGINIKMAKCGGLAPARKIIAAAREKGLLIMMGSMVQSSCGIGAACQLAPLADFVDLDCNLLLSNDPFEGHPVRDGLIYLNNLPGTGVRLREEQHLEERFTLEP